MAPKRGSSYEDKQKTVDVELKQEELQKLDEVRRPASTYPGWIIKRQLVDGKLVF